MPKTDRDDVQIVLGGISYGNWTDVEIDSDILTPADSFSLTACVPARDAPGIKPVVSRRDMFNALRAGATCEVYIGNDKQMVGFIDKPRYSGDRQRARIQLSGRDKGGYLVDSEANAILAENFTVETLVEKLLDPSFKIRDVIDSNEANRDLLLGKDDKRRLQSEAPVPSAEKPRKSTKIDPGRSIASIIDEHTRRLDLTWWMTAAGELFIGKPNYNQQVAYEFVLADAGNKDAKRNNVESWSFEEDIADRYSEIRVNGSGFGVKGDTFDTQKAAPRFTATATDSELVQRGIVRQLIIPDYDITSQQEAQKRADYEMGRRKFLSTSISLTVPGFRQGDRLYAIDTLASVRIDEAGIDGTYYVSQRQFIVDRSKKRTRLTLRPKGVWLA